MTETDAPESPKLRRERRRQRPLVQVERLSKVFAVRVGPWRTVQWLRAVDHVSLFVRHGESLGVTGHSGAGKSVLARALLRLTEPSYGRILLDEHDVTRLSESKLIPLRQRFRYLAQGAFASLDPRMPVRAHFEHVFERSRTPSTRTDFDRHVTALFDELGIPARALDGYPLHLSTSERQRIALARSLSGELRFLVLDDPTLTLDPALRIRAARSIQTRLEEWRAASLIASKDLQLLRHLCQRIAVMHAGRIVEVAPIQDWVEHRAHPYSRTLLGAAAAERRPRPRLRVILEGTPPDPLAPPAGCAFHPQCPRAEKGVCDIEAPPLRALAADSRHRVACHYPHV